MFNNNDDARRAFNNIVRDACNSMTNLMRDEYDLSDSSIDDFDTYSLIVNASNHIVSYVYEYDIDMRLIMNAIINHVECIDRDEYDNERDFMFEIMCEFVHDDEITIDALIEHEINN